VRHGEGHAAAGPPGIPHHLRGAGRRARRGGAPESGRVRRRGGRGTVRGLAAGGTGQPGVRGDGLALGGSGRPLPAGLGGAAARRAPGLVGGRPRVPRWGRSVLRGDPGGLRRDRRGAAAGRGPRPTGGTRRRPGRDRGQRAVRSDRGPAVRLGTGLRSRGVHRAAQYVLRAPEHGGLAAGTAVRGDPAAAGAPAGAVGAPGMGDGAARGAAAGAAVMRRRWRSAVVRPAGSG
jgi:hypothetical protein